MSDDSAKLETAVYRTRIQNGDFNLCVWIFDDVDEAKGCVEEFIELKYDMQVGEWSQDSLTNNHTLETGPDGFNAAVIVEDVHSTKDSALEGLRKRLEATA